MAQIKEFQTYPYYLLNWARFACIARYGMKHSPSHKASCEMQVCDEGKILDSRTWGEAKYIEGKLLRQLYISEIAWQLGCCQGACCPLPASQ